MASSTLSLKETFADLDTDFINIKHISEDKYVYNATDVLVQTTWELPIVIQYPESTVHFEFCSNPGDISFGIIFVASPEEGQDINDLEIETVQEMDIVRSNLESVSGSFEVPCEGVLFFMWDNNFDWSATKQISYLIEVSQPAFKYADLLRVDKCLPLLTETVEDLNAAYVRSADAQDCIEHNTANVSFLEEQLAALQRKRRIKDAEKQKLDAEIDALEKTVELGIVISPGLCIRGLEKSVLTHVLSFLNSSGAINSVCKYWSELAADIRVHEAATRLKTLPAPGKLLKRTKSEIKTSLAQIRAGIMLRDLARQQALARAEADALRASLDPDQSPAGQGLNLSTHGATGAGTGAGSLTPAMSVNSITAHAASSAASASNSNVAHLATAGAATTGAINTAAKDKTKPAAGATPEDIELTATSESEDSLQVSPVSDNHRKGTVPGEETSKANVRVSFDNVLPNAQNLHSSQFTKKTAPELSSPPMKQKGKKGEVMHSPAAGIATKVRPQPAAEAPEEVEEFARHLQWGRQRPLEGMRAAPLPVPPSKVAAQAGAADSPSRRPKKSKEGNKDSVPPPPAGVTESPKLPAVAESKRKSRVSVGKVTTAGAQATTSTAVAAASANSAPNAKKNAKSAAESENTRSLLQHVKKVRSEQQMNQMIEYLQAGFIKIETLTTEKRRIKKLIKAWNTSFEKKNARLPTSSERKGHLRELYEEYHQVALALRIRTEKMEDSLRTVGLTQEEYEALRDKKNHDW